jgi:hypothetical protein
MTQEFWRTTDTQSSRGRRKNSAHEFKEHKETIDIIILD